ncbi:MAG: hypothetical protein KDB00_03275 [Planctomycetales bacterium]|nr:hypothetical protein [Planctomycetales bacterium]
MNLIEMIGIQLTTDPSGLVEARRKEAGPDLWIDLELNTAKELVCLAHLGFVGATYAAGVATDAVKDSLSYFESDKKMERGWFLPFWMSVFLSLAVDDLKSFGRLCSYIDERLKPDDCSPLIDDGVQQVYKLLAIWYCNRDMTRVSRIDRGLSRVNSFPVKNLYAMACALRDEDQASFAASATVAIKAHLRRKPPKHNKDFLENWLPMHIMSVLLIGERCELIGSHRTELIDAFIVDLSSVERGRPRDGAET